MLERIQDLCKRKGISVAALAKEMNITTQAFYSSISGNPTLNRLKEIARLLGVEVQDLFERKEEHDDIIKFHFQCPCGKVHTISID